MTPQTTPTQHTHPTDATEAWTFTATPDEAQRVYLVLDGDGAPSRWIEMQPVTGKPGTWNTHLQLPQGQHRARYFTGNQGTYLNCGNFGLNATRTSEPCPGVTLEPLESLESRAA